MRSVLTIVMFLSSSIAAHAEDVQREKWVEQVGKATQSCLALFRQKFGDAKGHNFADCVTDQTSKAIEPCVGVSKNEFASCVAGRSLKVMETCDLTRC